MNHREGEGKSMDYQAVLYDKGEGIAVITLNRPKNMNALSSQLFSELDHVLAAIENDDEVKVVILAAFNRFEDMEKPVIAAVSGYALGGGCELALACDLRLPEIKIGVIPGAAGTQRLPRIIGITKAKELLYTGDFIDAQEAYRIGFVNKVEPVPSLMEEARKMAGKIARRPGYALRISKIVVNGGLNMDIKSAVAYEARCFEILFSTADQKEGMKAFVEKRKPAFTNR
jgi:enoyl-CoA hydratase